ncbi:MAG TPA: extracellular solute-binding protein [Candidatus Saccharimonadales bacterium]|nr:extracellular solute-binding protein [Candidatus Saccharimonadales bacterium]
MSAILMKTVLAILAGLMDLALTSRAIAAMPMSIAQLALYQGADREKILLDGAKRDGQLTLYDSHTWYRTYVKEFEKKYPFIAVSEWRNDSKNLIRRAMEEFNSRRVIADVIETTSEGMGLMRRDGLFQEYFTPEARFYPDTVKSKGKSGLHYLGNRETYNSLGFNTTLISPNDAPKSIKDLLDPKWKGKMSVAGTSTGVRWVGCIIEVMGREFFDKLADQEIKVQDMSGAALAGLVGSGEVPLSPTIFDADVTVAKQKGAPIEWRPLEPVVTTVGYSALSAKTPHPHAALLFLDYLHSKEGQQLIIKGGLWSPRDDTGTREQKFKKLYLDEKYSLEEIETKFSQWEKLMRQLSMRKK